MLICDIYLLNSRKMVLFMFTKLLKNVILFSQIILEKFMLKTPYNSTKKIEERFIDLYGEISDFQKIRYQNLFSRFCSCFNEDKAYFASSSGRVEVCGNHTDHNGGRVVSCAISLDTVAAFLPTNDGVIHIKSEGYEDIIIDVNGVEKEKIGTSSALVRGVVVGLQKRNYCVGGFNACFTSNVLGGAGISSSASFELIVAEILNFLYNDEEIDAEEKAKIAQFSENVYFGKPCGLLDQTAIAFGGLKRLDFSNPEKIAVTEINNSLTDYTLILINTGGSHADLTDEYAAIPKEMFYVANTMGKDKLIEVGEDNFYSNLPELYNKIPDRAILRSIHFFAENKRVDGVYSALNNEDYVTFIKMLNKSGESSLYMLQNCFVQGRSEQPIPKAIAVIKNILPNCACRVHGGGFAGSVLVVVKNEEKEDFLLKINKYFTKENIIPLKVRTVGAIVL